MRGAAVYVLRCALVNVGVVAGAATTDTIEISISMEGAAIRRTCGPQRTRRDVAGVDRRGRHVLGIGG